MKKPVSKLKFFKATIRHIQLSKSTDQIYSLREDYTHDDILILLKSSIATNFFKFDDFENLVLPVPPTDDIELIRQLRVKTYALTSLMLQSKANFNDSTIELLLVGFKRESHSFNQVYYQFLSDSIDTITDVKFKNGLLALLSHAPSTQDSDLSFAMKSEEYLSAVNFIITTKVLSDRDRDDFIINQKSQIGKIYDTVLDIMANTSTQDSDRLSALHIVDSIYTLPFKSNPQLELRPHINDIRAEIHTLQQTIAYT